MKPFCASCLAESSDLERSYLTERPVLLCSCCRDEHPRSGRWSFEGGKDRGPFVHARPAEEAR